MLVVAHAWSWRRSHWTWWTDHASDTGQAFPSRICHYLWVAMWWRRLSEGKGCSWSNSYTWSYCTVPWWHYALDYLLLFDVKPTAFAFGT